jgi:HEAT repeat protein
MRRLVIAACFGLCCCGDGALAAEPAGEFLGKSHEQWVAELKSESASQRHLAAWALAQSLPTLADPLFVAAQHGDPVVRYWGTVGIIRTAERDGFTKEFSVALASLFKDKSPAVRLAAAEGVARLGDDPAAIGALIEALADPQEAVRIQAIGSLERLGAKCAPLKEPIEKATSGDTSEYVQRISTRLLARFNHKAP